MRQASHAPQSVATNGVMSPQIAAAAPIALDPVGSAAKPSAAPMSPSTTCPASASSTPAMTDPQCSRGNARPPATSVDAAMSHLPGRPSAHLLRRWGRAWSGTTRTCARC